MTQLIRYEAARQALAEAVAFDEVMSIMNVAEQAALYAKQANDSELIEKATEIRVRAQRKAGAMLRQSAEEGGRATVASGVQRGANKHLSVGATSAPTLAEIGITKDQSSQYQQLASMSDEHFETAVATAKETAGQVTSAFMLREVAKAKPHAAPMKGKKADAMREELKAAKGRGASVLMTYARALLGMVNVQEEINQEERELLVELAAVIDSKLSVKS